MAVHPVSAMEALAKLREGNRRFATGGIQAFSSPELRAELTAGQAPFAVILGCSDSRVPVEIVFGQGLGDLFVIRVAGNIVAPSLIGSVEFAALTFGTRLVVVLGHSGCGAVTATIEELERSVGSPSRNLGSIVNRIRPVVEPLFRGTEGLNRDELIERAVRANISAAANHLRRGSAILERLEDEEGLLVVGAEYSLESGEVDFFAGVPDAA